MVCVKCVYISIYFYFLLFIFVTSSFSPNQNTQECVVTGRRYTFGHILDQGLKWGGIVNTVLPPLSPSSTPKLRTVTIFMKNSPEFPLYLLGSMAAGATIATINSNYTAGERERERER